MGSVIPAGAVDVDVAAACDVPPRLVALVGACQGCGACLLTCPERAIRPHGGALLVCADRCSGCGECVEVCPVDAIDLVVGCGVSGGAL